MDTLSDALYEVMNRKAKIGFNDKEGHRVIRCRFDWASPNGFHEGLCLVANRENNEIKIGYINRMGKMVINGSRYEYASDFKNGYAPVTKDGLWGMIDKMGKEVVPCKYDMIGEFHEGLVPVMKDSLWGYVNTEGIEVSPCKYKAAKYFRDGCTVVATKEGCGIIDNKGEEVIHCKYEGIYNFKGGLALVKKDGLWGAVNKKGEIVIPCEYRDESLDESYFDDEYQISNEELKKRVEEMLS